MKDKTKVVLLESILIVSLLIIMRNIILIDTTEFDVFVFHAVAYLAKIAILISLIVCSFYVPYAYFKQPEILKFLFFISASFITLSIVGSAI